MIYCPYCMNELKGSESVCRCCGKEPASYAPLPHMLPHEALLNNRYLVGAVIGEGGFGITYIGLDSLLEYRVAIKEFYPNGMVTRNNAVSNAVNSISTDTSKELVSKSRERFLAEARMLAKFNNEKGIVEVKDFFEENGTVYIVMEYLDGITLKKYLATVGTMSAYNTVCLLMPVFNSLNKIHHKNLIHRDISPDNIMLVDEEVKLLDFGAAREFADEKSLSVMLKHGYAPLEQYRRHGAQGSWTDVYAICATMYKCITGEIPPDAPDRIYEDEIKMPSELGFDVSPEFEKVLLHGLAIKAEERIQDIDGLLSEIAAVPGFEDVRGGVSGSVSSGQEHKAADDGSVTVPQQEDEQRFSQYISAPLPDEDEPKEPPKQEEAPKPEPEKSSEEKAPEPEKPHEKPKNEKKDFPKAAIIAAAAVVAVAAGIGIFLAMSGDNDVGRDESSLPKTGSSSAAVEADSSKPAEDTSSADTSEDKSSAESAADSSSEETSVTDSSGSSGTAIDKFIYNFTVTDHFFTINPNIFDAKLEDIEATYGMGDDSADRSDPDWIEGEAVLTVPVSKEFVTVDGQASDTEVYVKLFFKNDKLVMVLYQYFGSYDPAVEILARAAYGDPVSANESDSEWLLDDGSLYQIYVRSQDGEDSFAQMYVSNDFLTEQGILN